MAAIRAGQDLLVGPLRCGHCGRKLHVRYWGGRGTNARYLCKGDFDDGGQYCRVWRQLGRPPGRTRSTKGDRASGGGSQGSTYAACIKGILFFRMPDILRKFLIFSDQLQLATGSIQTSTRENEIPAG